VGDLVLRPQHHSPAAECSPDSVGQGESVGLEAQLETESSGRLDISQAFILSGPVSKTMVIHLSSRVCSTLAQRQMEKKIL